MVVELTDEQKDIVKGRICPYCKSKPVLIDSAEVYGVSYGPMWICKPCDAYCGCHPGTKKPLGRLANKKLRFWKKEAHAYFDNLWKGKHMRRNAAYKWLSNHLLIPHKYTHIGMFSEFTCRRVVVVVKKYFAEQKIKQI